MRGQGGFLAPESEAAHQIALTKETGERALLLLNHLPMLSEWNAELLVLRTFATQDRAAVDFRAARANCRGPAPARGIRRPGVGGAA
jgi:hypothetical protein